MGYEVKKGDGWYKIAKNLGVDVNELLKANNASLDTMLHPGQQIKTSKPELVTKQVSIKPEDTEDKQISKADSKETVSEVNPMNPYGTYVAWTPTYKKGENCGVDGCAKYANDSLKGHKDTKGRRLYSSDNIGGHAWTRLLAGKDSKMIYSGYDSEDYDRTKFSNAASDARNFKAADKLLKEFDSKTLDPNKIYMVNMFYKGSPSRKQAWEEALGGTTGTHTGNLYFNKDTNKWHVSHNIHGTVYDDDFIKIQGSRGRYGVTAIAEAPATDYTEADRREDYRQRKPIRGWIRDQIGWWKQGGNLIPKAEGGMELPEVTVTAINPNREGISEEGKQFIMGLNNNRNHFMQKYNMSDEQYADVSKLAVNLAQRESTLGSGKSYQVRKFIPDSIIGLGKQILRGNSGYPSRGLTQIKYQQDIKNPELKQLYDEEGITDDNLQDSPEKMAAATVTRLMFNKKSLKPKYHYSDGEEIPSDVAQAMYWNRGRLTDGANPNITNLDVGGATGYARRFVNQKVI